MYLSMCVVHSILECLFYTCCTDSRQMGLLAALLYLQWKTNQLLSKNVWNITFHIVAHNFSGAQRYGTPLLDGYGCFRTTVAFNAHRSCQLWYIIYIREETTMTSQLKMANFRDEFTGSERFPAQRRNAHNFQCDFVQFPVSLYNISNFI